jgi:hypothetical protein
MTELERVGQRYQRRRQILTRTHAQLVPLILEARRQGLSLRQIADVTGLSFARIYQIDGHPPKRRERVQDAS